MRHLADLAGQADLAEGHQVGGQRAVGERADQGQAHGQVGAGLGQADAADGRHVHVDVAGDDACPSLEHGEQQREAARVEALCAAPRRAAGVAGVGERLHLDEQWPLPFERGQHGAARHAGTPVGEEQLAGVGHPDQPLFDHLEQAELVGGAEAVLDRAQQTQRVVPVALEAQHDVDHVLERARSGQGAVFGDMADEHDRDATRLGLVHQPRRTAANLDDAAGRGAQLGIGHALDAVDDHERGLHLIDGRHDVGHHRLAQQPQLGVQRAEAFGAQAYLGRALLGAHVEGALAPRGEQLQEQRGLADAGLAAEQGDRTGHDAVTEHTVELGQPGGCRPLQVRVVHAR